MGHCQQSSPLRSQQRTLRIREVQRTYAIEELLVVCTYLVKWYPLSVLELFLRPRFELECDPLFVVVWCRRQNRWSSRLSNTKKYISLSLQCCVFNTLSSLFANFFILAADWLSLYLGTRPVCTSTARALTTTIRIVSLSSKLLARSSYTA